VGKTTCSATTALHYASLGRRTLIISSDLTPSLSDIFEMEIGPTEKTVPGVDNLDAVGIGPDEVMNATPSMAASASGEIRLGLVR
jgi:arsenite-transporting ATPase